MIDMTKKTLLMAMAIMMGLAATAQNTITFKGSIRNAEGKKVLLMYSDGADKSDSTVIKDGKFSFTEKISAPYTEGVIVVGKYDPRSRDMKYLRAYADANTQTVIDGDYNDLSCAKIVGGKTQREANILADMQRTAIQESKVLDAAYTAAKTEADRDSVKALMQPFSDFSRASMVCFVKTHPDSYIAPDQLMYLMGDMSYDEIKAIYEKFTPEVRRNSSSCKAIEHEMSMLAKLSKGAPAPDFTTTDINGKPFTLSSLKGKVVILDFWASWCVPCRRSNPHMRELYDTYHAKGLDMVYVADDDSNVEKWKTAVAKDQLIGEGYHHVLRGMKWDRTKGLEGIDHSNDISDKYAIHYLPTKYLLDRNGNIVCKIGEGDEEKLDLWLAYLLR